jgi:hypothetical protein
LGATIMTKDYASLPRMKKAIEALKSSAQR